ncbi:MAG: TorF family putative porin [Gammaproteobacteria bacterium]
MRALPFLLCAVVLTATAADRLGGSVGVTSDYRLQGLSLSANTAAPQAELHFQQPTEDRGAWYAGLWASSVRLSNQSSSSAQIGAFLGRQFAVGPDWLGSVAVSHYAHPWNALLKKYDYDELTIGASFRDRLKFTATYSPDTDLYSYYGFIENRRSIAYELAGTVPVRGPLAASAGVGFRDVSSFFNTGYWYGSAGLAYDRGRVHASVLRIQTDRTARRLFYGDVVDPAWVGTLLWTF